MLGQGPAQQLLQGGLDAPFSTSRGGVLLDAWWSLAFLGTRCSPCLFHCDHHCWFDQRLLEFSWVDHPNLSWTSQQTGRDVFDKLLLDAVWPSSFREKLRLCWWFDRSDETPRTGPWTTWTGWPYLVLLLGLRPSLGSTTLLGAECWDCPAV